MVRELCTVQSSSIKKNYFRSLSQGIFKVAECYREGQGSRAYALNDSARSAAMSAAHFQLFQCGSRAGWHAWLRRRPVRWCENSVKFYSTEFLDHHFCSFPPQGFRFVVTNTQARRLVGRRHCARSPLLLDASVVVAICTRPQFHPPLIESHVIFVQLHTPP